MLKIKDSVDLKELEKFGFIKHKRIDIRHDKNGSYEEEFYLKDYGDTIIEVCISRINSDWRHLNDLYEVHIGIDQECSGGALEYVIQDIYDLTQARLVEKVE